MREDAPGGVWSAFRQPRFLQIPIFFGDLGVERLDSQNLGLGGCALGGWALGGWALGG